MLYTQNTGTGFLYSPQKMLFVYVLRQCHLPLVVARLGEELEDSRSEELVVATQQDPLRGLHRAFLLVELPAHPRHLQQQLHLQVGLFTITFNIMCIDGTQKVNVTELRRVIMVIVHQVSFLACVFEAFQPQYMLGQNFIFFVSV